MLGLFSERVLSEKTREDRISILVNADVFVEWCEMSLTIV